MITPKTIAQFLFGNRAAIEEIASNKWSLLLGFLFIISAGLARNYDHHLLTKEFLWIGGPIGMSLFSSVFIYGFIKVFGRLRTEGENQNYFPFLRCFVMTAPLAWFYGIPVEQFTSSLNSAIFNFVILLAVSVWRVALMVKVTVVLFRFHPLRAFSLIAIPASFEMFVATIFKSVDIVGVMAGMSLNEAESFLLKAANTMTVGSVILFCISLCLVFCSEKGDVKNREEPTSKRSISSASWSLAIIAIALWLWASLVPQQRLRNLNAFQSHIRSENYQEAANFAESVTEKGFPRHHRLFPKGFFHQPPVAIKLLASYNRWPTWLEEKFKEDVSAWLTSPHRTTPDPESNYFELYHHLKDAPFAQEAADIVTPGVKASDYFSKKKKSPKDQPQ